MLVSDHGFHSDHLRPKFTPRVPAGITVWHRPQGVIAACGPGFKTDELVFGARLLDIAPTVLHYFGLPVGEDMEGRVLEDVFTERRPVETQPTWENPDAPRQARAESGAAADKALLEQFVALGYIDEVPEDPEQARVETSRENDWNMARALMYAQRFEQTLPLLEGCHHAQPARPDFAQVLAQTQRDCPSLSEAMPLDHSGVAAHEPGLAERFAQALYLPGEGQLDNRQLLDALLHSLQGSLSKSSY
jgi:hypothetical protein